MVCLCDTQVSTDDEVIESVRRRVPCGDIVHIFKNHHGVYDELVSSSVAGTTPSLTLQSQDCLVVQYPVCKVDVQKIPKDDYALVKCLLEGTTSMHKSLTGLLNANVESTTLVDSLRNKFAREETLTGSEQWMCPKCSKKVDAATTSWITRLPKVLLVQLKRFFCTLTFQTKIKIPVNFPLQGLDLAGFRTGLSLPLCSHCSDVGSECGYTRLLSDS